MPQLVCRGSGVCRTQVPHPVCRGAHDSAGVAWSLARFSAGRYRCFRGVDNGSPTDSARCAWLSAGANTEMGGPTRHPRPGTSVSQWFDTGVACLGCLACDKSDTARWAIGALGWHLPRSHRRHVQHAPRRPDATHWPAETPEPRRQTGYGTKTGRPGTVTDPMRHLSWRVLGTATDRMRHRGGQTWNRRHRPDAAPWLAGPGHRDRPDAVPWLANLEPQLTRRGT